MLAPAIDPGNPRRVGLGVDGDGVYESRDAGHSWHRCRDRDNDEAVAVGIGPDGRIVVAGPHSYVLARSCRILRHLPGIEDGAAGPMLVRRDAIHVASEAS